MQMQLKENKKDRARVSGGRIPHPLPSVVLPSLVCESCLLGSDVACDIQYSGSGTRLRSLTG